MKLAIYGHGGSENHGNEAIVRGVRELFPDSDLSVYTLSLESDVHYGLEECCNLKEMTCNVNKKYLFRAISRLFSKSLYAKKYYYTALFKPFIDDINPDTIYLLEAGDQYCELGDHVFFYGMLSKIIKRKGAKSVMLGCTINPELLQNNSVIENLNSYAAIISRESITYNALKKANLSVPVYFAPDPAFAMKSRECDLQSWIEKKQFVGFNVGFLQQGNEPYYDLLMMNYENAIEMILRETDLDVALIPHVNWSYRTTDFTALDVLYRKFKDSNRVHYIEEHSAPIQKYIISKAKIFVSLRTHATIPAIESGVPTIITGYKTKSKGLAVDIFKDNFSALADVQSLTDENEIAEKLRLMLLKEDEIRDFYKRNMPSYLDGLNSIIEIINGLR